MRRQKQKEDKKDKKAKIVPLLLITGLALSVAYLFSPMLEDGINSANTVVQIQDYAKTENSAETKELEEAKSQAQKYNDEIFKEQKGMDTDSRILNSYQDILNLNHDNMMAALEIPSLNIFLPVEHGTSDAVMQQAVGHMEKTSVPYGGVDTHSVLSSHTGLESARLFSDLDKLKKGDIFYIHVLGETHAYQCDRIHTVKPEEADPYLQIIPGADLVTLYTCTPYGVNTHRLLVTGKRIKTKETTERFAKAIHSTRKTAALECLTGAGIPILIWVIGVAIVCRKAEEKTCCIGENQEKRDAAGKQELPK